MKSCFEDLQSCNECCLYLVFSNMLCVSILSMRYVTNLVQHSLQWQEEKEGDVPRVLQRYTAEKLSCFGELALM